MSERHKQTREAPQHQRPPHNRGWSRRRSDVLGDATVWRIWRPASDGRILQIQVTVTDLEMALAGRWTAARRLKAARREMRLALVA
jgi:CelD/BcsL family acetyltransferase involved in cellulose biosynthesis